MNITTAKQGKVISALAIASLLVLACAGTAFAQSADANLSALTPSAGTLDPVFDSGTISYTASVPYATAIMTVTPTAADAGATITVNGNSVTSGNPSGSISLSVGANVITTVVTAEDTVTTKTYTLTVTRAAASTNADLSALVPSAGTLSPTFASGTISYTASVPGATTSMTVTPTAADAGATITVNGNPVISGSPSAAINLSVGANVITTVVTAEDAVTAETYTLTVTRPRTTTYSGANGAYNSDTWNNVARWNNGIPDNTTATPWDVQIANSVTAGVALTTTPVYTGSLTLGTNSQLVIGEGSTVNGLRALGTGPITFNTGSTITLRWSTTSTHSQSIVMAGNATFGIGSSTAAHNDDRTLTGVISGSGKLSVRSTNGQRLTIQNTNPDWSGGIVMGGALSENKNESLRANASGAFGTGNVTVDDGVGLVISVANAIGDAATLTLNGGDGEETFKLNMGASDTINQFFYNGLQLPAGNYTSSTAPWITGAGTLTVSTGSGETIAPTVISMVDNVGGGPIYEDQAQVTYTVTFSEEVAPNLTTADFEVVGTGAASGTITSVTKTSIYPAPAGYTVVVSPSGTGTIQLQIKATSVIKDLYLNSLVVPVADNNIISINAGTNPGTGNRWWDGTTITGITNGASGGGAGTWSTGNTNWDRGAGFASPVAWDNGGNNNAIFSGAETVERIAAVSGTINLKDLTFDTTGASGTKYKIDGGTLNFSSGAVIKANDNRYDQTITSVIIGSPAVQTRDNGAGNTYKGLIFAPASGTQSLGAVLNPNNTGSSDKAGVTFGGSITGNTIASISYAGTDQYADTNFTGGGWTVAGTVATGTLRISGGRLIINGNTTLMYNGLIMSSTGILGGSTTIFKDDRRAANDFVSGTGIAPGNGVGTLTFDWGINGTPLAGQWTTAFRAGSNYEWQVGASATDVVHVVDGNLIVEGFTLKVIDAGGTPANGAVQLPVFTYGTLNTKTLNLAAVQFDTSDLVGKGWTIGTLALAENTDTKTIYLTGLSKTAGYTVTYDGNGSTGGSVPVDGATYATDATVTVLGNTGSLVNTGLVFTGWNTQADGLGTHYAATGLVTFDMGAANVTLYAEWKTPYQIWATGSESFSGDANGDGVKDGIAFLLGAANPNENATSRLPTVTESGGNLILTFNCLPVAARGGSLLKVAYGNTLASWTAATNVVPDATGADVGGVVSYVVDTVSEAPLNKITATIDSAAAGSGKLFGELQATK